ncbi:CehA/McbA family metallohydrolase [Nonomuraea sp. NPDC004297]
MTPPEPTTAELDFHRGHRAQHHRHVDRVRRSGGLCVAAHPYAPYPSGVFMYPYGGFDVVEVWNGRWASDLPWNADNEAALAEWGRALAYDVHRGAWRPAMGNSDAHLDGQIGTPHTVVLAEEPSARAFLAAIRAGRSWIAESTAIDLSFHAAAAGEHRAGPGERLVTGGGPATVRVDVRGVPSGVVTFHTERGAVRRETLPADGSGTVEWRTGAAESFVRVEVRHAGGRMAALTNPVILT